MITCSLFEGGGTCNQPATLLPYVSIDNSSSTKKLIIKTTNLVQSNLKIKVKLFLGKKVKEHTPTELNILDQFKGNSKQTKFNKLVLLMSNKINLFWDTKLSKNKKILWNMLIITKELFLR